MTIIETIPPAIASAAPPARGPVRSDGRARACTRPLPPRPGGAPLRYRGSGVPMSRVAHGNGGATTPAATIGLALLAALITGWLGLVGQFGASAAGQTGTVPDQLGVVRVQDGESLQRLAARVAPGAPTGEVVARIRELNRLDSAAVEAGETLIAPIG